VNKKELLPESPIRLAKLAITQIGSQAHISTSIAIKLTQIIFFGICFQHLPNFGAQPFCQFTSREHSAQLLITRYSTQQTNWFGEPFSPSATGWYKPKHYIWTEFFSFSAPLFIRFNFKVDRVSHTSKKAWSYPKAHFNYMQWSFPRWTNRQIRSVWNWFFWIPLQLVGRT